MDEAVRIELAALRLLVQGALVQDWNASGRDPQFWDAVRVRIVAEAKRQYPDDLQQTTIRLKAIEIIGQIFP